MWGALFIREKAVLSLQALLNQLRAVFDQIIELQSTQDAICRAALEELQRRLQFEDKKKQREAEVWFGGGWHVGLGGKQLPWKLQALRDSAAVTLCPAGS